MISFFAGMVIMVLGLLTLAWEMRYYNRPAVVFILACIAIGGGGGLIIGGLTSGN
jgi:hypothetical protein